jgi:uncharacterized protein (TIGR03790 family)
MDLKVAEIDKIERGTVLKNTNPYFGKKDAFTHKKYGMYLVTRLDGYNVDDCKRLVDNAMSAKAEKGPFFFDAAGNRKTGSYGQAQSWLGQADVALRAKGFSSKLEDTDTFLAPDGPLMGYASWGSNDGKFSDTAYQSLKFKPGALAETYVSTSGRTFELTTGGQSLIADLIANGVTGVKGYVAEPYAFSLTRVHLLFDRYTSGANLAESFWSATPLIRWKDVVIGDPLCAPYKR